MIIWRNTQAPEREYEMSGMGTGGPKRRAGRSASAGFALAETMLLIVVFLCILTACFSMAGFRNRTAVMRIRSLEARSVAEAAVRMAADELMLGALSSEDFGKHRTEMVFEPDDGGEPVTMPVMIWAKVDGDRMSLYAEAEVGGRHAIASVHFRRNSRVVTASSADACEWVCVGADDDFTWEFATESDTPYMQQENRDTAGFEYEEE